MFFCLSTGVQQGRHPQGGLLFYVTGTTKQELFNTAEKTKESIVDDIGNADFKTLSISPPDSSPDSFHEVPVDCPEEVPVDIPESKIQGKQGHVQVGLLRAGMGGWGIKHSNNIFIECWVKKRHTLYNYVVGC